MIKEKWSWNSKWFIFFSKKAQHHRGDRLQHRQDHRRDCQSLSLRSGHWRGGRLEPYWLRPWQLQTGQLALHHRLNFAGQLPGGGAVHGRRQPGPRLRRPDLLLSPAAQRRRWPLWGGHAEHCFAVEARFVFSFVVWKVESPKSHQNDFASEISYLLTFLNTRWPTVRHNLTLVGALWNWEAHRSEVFSRSSHAKSA